MLYVTTRVSGDAFTAFRAMTENRGPEGGFYAPLRLPCFDDKKIAELSEKSFACDVAETLNLFFGTQMDSGEIELSIGRYPVKLVPLNGKVMAVNTWNNPACRFERLVCGVEKVIRQSDQISSTPSDWMLIAARIAVLFGIYGQLMRNKTITECQKIDVSVPGGDLSRLMAVWYAREMGLPVGTIICCCNENNALWSLLHKGELRTDAISNRTHTPECDYSVPTDLERLIFAVFGHEEVKRYREICMTGGVYYLDAEQMTHLCTGIYVSVVSEKRMGSVIPNLYKTTGFLADPYTALAYSGLTDYRSTSGISAYGLIISEESPLFSLEFVASCMGMLPAELRRLLK